jgi:hypothetical protein
MIIYNITIKVEPAAEAAWLQWQREEHIPEILSSGKFMDHSMYRLLEQDESDGITYVTQFRAYGMDQYLEYIENFAPLLRQKSFDKWGNRFIAFRSLLEVIH